MDGSLQDGLLALVASVRDPSKLFAEKLNKALCGGDTNTVARIVLGTKEVTRFEGYQTSYKHANTQTLLTFDISSFSKLELDHQIWNLTNRRCL